MNNYLNSPLVQTLLKLLMSRTGQIAALAVNWLLGLITAHVAIPSGDLHNIQLGLTQLAMALLTALWGWLVVWIQHRQKDGVRALQVMLNKSDIPSPIVKVDGIAGNETLLAGAQITDVTVREAVQAVARQ